MTNRLTILDQIEADLNNSLTSEKDYQHTPVEIKRGIHKWDDFLVKPVVCFTLTADLPDDDNQYGEDARWLTIMFYIYSQTDGGGSTNQIHEMVDDLETFIQSDHFTYSDQTLILDIEVLEGGTSSPINTAIMQTRIIYES